MELPQLTTAQIEEALKGTKYEGAFDISLKDGVFFVGNDAALEISSDAYLNAARAILLARELEAVKAQRDMLVCVARSASKTMRRIKSDVIIFKCALAPSDSLLHLGANELKREADNVDAALAEIKGTES